MRRSTMGRVALALLPFVVLAAFALELRTARAEVPTIVDEAELGRALRVAVSTADGRWPVRHCREAGEARPGDDRWSRCDRRVRAFARLFVQAGAVHQVDPWLLAAQASRESGLHPWAEGAAGEIGVMQLHPRGAGALIVRGLARDRARCERRADACQRPVIDRAAAHLRRAIERCGDEASALGAYNRGRCGATDYSRRVLRRREQLRLWCTTSEEAAQGPGPWTAADPRAETEHGSARASGGG